ncbi:class I SAM-dependent methyltransferase [bacterium]|jgi:2-polyprenyl-3-methyl-5-hydroxy-6-metoxy-1,4-benzoquinol methylase|nr:class I SAM-dependent methyltransferase [bacterium]
MLYKVIATSLNLEAVSFTTHLPPLHHKAALPPVRRTANVETQTNESDLARPTKSLHASSNEKGPPKTVIDYLQLTTIPEPEDENHTSIRVKPDAAPLKPSCIEWLARPFASKKYTQVTPKNTEEPDAEGITPSEWSAYFDSYDKFLAIFKPYQDLMKTTVDIIENHFKTLHPNATPTSTPFEILDLGCGSGNLAATLREKHQSLGAPKWNLTGVDSAKKGIELSKKKAEAMDAKSIHFNYSEGDITTPNFGSTEITTDAKYDVINLTNVWYALPENKRSSLLDEMKDHHLASNGIIIVNDRQRPFTGGTHLYAIGIHLTEDLANFPHQAYTLKKTWKNLKEVAAFNKKRVTDGPCSFQSNETQVTMFKKKGFTHVQKLDTYGNTTIMNVYKGPILEAESEQELVPTYVPDGTASMDTHRSGQSSDPLPTIVDAIRNKHGNGMIRAYPTEDSRDSSTRRSKKH